MKSDINLISLSQTELVKEDRLVKLLRTFAIISIVAVTIISLVIFIIIQSISPAEVRKQEGAIEGVISSLHTKEAKIVIVNKKIKDIKNIISKRPKYDSIVSDIANIIPGDVSMNSLNVNEKKVKLIVTSSSLLSINSFLDNLFDMVANKKIIGNLTIDGISEQGGNGAYTMSVSGDRI